MFGDTRDARTGRHRDIRHSAARHNTDLVRAAIGGVQPGIGHFQPQVVTQRNVGAALKSLAPRTGHIAVAAASTGIACHGQFVLGVRAEQRGVHLDAVVSAPLCTQLIVVAHRGLQVERKSRLAICAIAQLVERGRFKALATDA